MIPVKCRVPHRPEEGLYGDCVRACIASIMEMDAEQVPHFHHDDAPHDIIMKRVGEWLGSHGYARFACFCEGDMDISEVLALIGTMNPGIHYMLTGMTTEGGLHMVVCCNDKIVNNPAWFSLPLVGPVPGEPPLWPIQVIAKP